MGNERNQKGNNDLELFSLDDFISFGASFLNGKIFEANMGTENSASQGDLSFSNASKNTSSNDQHKYFQIKLAEIEDPVPVTRRQDMH